MRRPRPRPAAPRPVLQLVHLEDRVTPAITFAQPYGGTNISGSNGQSVAVGDYTGDGKPDIALGVFTLGVDLLVNNGSGQFAENGSLVMGTNHVAVVDMNGDGIMDLVSSHDFGNQLCFARGLGNGVFETPIIRDMGDTVQGVVTADITGDGKRDVVITTDNSLKLVPNDGTPNVITGAVTTYSQTGWLAFNLATGDFNKDGKADIAAAGRTTHAVHVFLNNGAGGLAPGVAFPTTGNRQAAHVLVGDVNNDTNPDMLVQYFDANQVAIYLGAGNGTFTFATPSTVSAPDRGPVALADFDADGNLDLAVEGDPSSKLFIFAGNGNGTFSVPTTYDDGINPGDVALADINLDGQVDIVNSWGSSPAGYSVRLNTSNGSSASSFAVDAPPSAVAGQGFSVTVTARDQSGMTQTGYRGTVNFTSTDLLVSAGNGLPANYTFTAADNGVHTFTNVMLRTAASITVTVRDTVSTAVMGSDSVNVAAGTAAAVAVVSGTGQSATVNTNFANQLVAKVTDAFGNAVSGVTVTFAGPASGAGATFPSGATAVSNASGQAGVTVKANTAVGSYAVTATAIGTPASFNLTNMAGAAASIAVVSGNGQSAPIGTTFGDQLVAVVTDAFGNAVSGVTVTFAGPASGAGATFPSGATATTNADGQAGVSVNANAVTGSYAVTATTAGAAGSASFDLTNLAGVPAAIAAVSGGGQTATVNTAFGNQLVAKVTDAVGNGVSGVTVTFAGPGSGAGVTFPSGATATTDSNGEASITVAANTTTGSYSVTATTAGVGGGASFGLTNAAGAPAALAVVSGSGQATAVNTAFTNTLVAKVTDGFGNAVPDVMVSFAGPGSGAGATFPSGTNATTNSAGQTALPISANTVTGLYSVTATTAGVAGSVSFALTNTAGTVAQLDVVSGDGQSATVNTNFGAALVVRAMDAFGNLVSGAIITFAGPGSGAGATFPGGGTAMTNASGQASVTAKANTVAGSYAVTATTTGVGTPASFDLTNNPGAGIITVLSGGSQSAGVGTPFGNPLVARVRDTFGNPVSGVAVTFVGPAIGAGVTFPVGATATTDANGQASVTVAANNAAGSYLATASAPGVTGQASFTLMNSAGAAAAIAVGSGTGQAAAVTAGFVSLLAARVTDAFGNGVPGVTVTFAGPTSGAGVTFPVGATAISDPSGRASVAVVANTFAGSYVVTATAAGIGTPASFNLTNTPAAPATIVVASGGGQSAAVGNAFGDVLLARVTDTFGNPIAGATVTFAGPTAGAGVTFPSGTSAMTDAAGLAGVSVAANTVTGAFAVTAATAGVSGSASFSLTNSAGAAAAIVAVSGGGQSAVVNTSFTSPLVARVTDAFGNPVAGVAVTFGGSGVTFPAGATATTNAAGQAALGVAANTVAGSSVVTATVAGVAGSASFDLTNTAGVVALVTPVSGSGQSATVNTAFADPLVVEATDAFGNPVAGATVSFTDPTSGAGVTFPAGATATTGADGRVSVAVAAKTVSGSYAVSAKVGIATGSFALTNTAGAAASVAVAVGDGQTAVVGTTFSFPLGVRVTDAFGNPVPGVVVSFTGSGVTFPDSTTSTSTAGGLAGVPVTANTAAGPATVVASVAGVAVSVTFNLSKTAGSPATVTVVGGDGQSAPAGSAFAAPLAVRVTDAFGNPVGGVLVRFVAPASGATAIFTDGVIATTNTDGRAAVPAAAGTTGGSYAVTASFTNAPAPATFTLTNTAGAAAGLVVSGRADGSAATFASNGSGGFNTTPTSVVRPFPGFAGEVRVAGGDFDGDGVRDTVLVTGPGTKTAMAVVSGKDGSLLLAPADPFGDANFVFGGFVTAGDMDGDGRSEWVVTPELRGGPRVIIFELNPSDPRGFDVVGNFFGIQDESFRDGARAALGDVNRDGVLDVFAIAAFNGGPRTALFNGADVLVAGGQNRAPVKLTGDFFAAPSGADEGRGGRGIAAGDVTGDGVADFIATGDNLLGTGNQVVIFSGADLIGGRFPGVGATPIASFTVGGASGGSLVSVAAVSTDGDTRADLAVGSGAGQPSAVRMYLGTVLSGSSEPPSVALDPFGTVTPNGVFVG